MGPGWRPGMVQGSRYYGEQHWYWGEATCSRWVWGHELGVRTLFVCKILRYNSEFSWSREPLPTYRRCLHWRRRSKATSACVLFLWSIQISNTPGYKDIWSLSHASLCTAYILGWPTKLQRITPRRVKLVFLMPHTIYRPGFSLLFDNIVKVIFYLKARSYKQYLAVALFPSRPHSPDIGTGKAKWPSHSMWCLLPSRNVSKNDSKVPDFGQMKCEMVLYLDSGPAYGLRWWPLPHMNWYLLYSTYAFMSDVFCDSSMMTNDNRRIWDCLAELLKTELWLFMRFLIHQTWYLLIMISPILFVARLTLLLSKPVRFTHSFF